MKHTISLNDFNGYSHTEIITSGETVDGKRKRLKLTATLTSVYFEICVQTSEDSMLWDIFIKCDIKSAIEKYNSY